jgi:hypothetical protein
VCAMLASGRSICGRKTLQKLFPNRRNRTMIFSKPVRD